MAKSEFGGASKVGKSILYGPECRLREAFVDRIPAWCETYHLTMMTLVWAVLVVVAGLLARRDGNLQWLWLVSLMIVLQYLTDLFDGAIGRKRNTGLVKWGFFMDHFLDFVFQCSLITAYYLVAPPGYGFWFMLLLGLTGAHMVHSFLSFAATNEFEIYFYGFGPTEARIGFILINTFIIYTWPQFYEWTLPVLTVLVALALVVLVYRTHRRLWALDMAEKARQEAEKGGQ
jgi:phosphatidylglycerophosphate synthase